MFREPSYYAIFSTHSRFSTGRESHEIEAKRREARERGCDSSLWTDYTVELESGLTEKILITLSHIRSISIVGHARARTQ